MMQAARNALMDHLPKDRIIDCYLRGMGDEISSGAFSSPTSSANLAANAFGFFIESPRLLCLPSRELAGTAACKVDLERELRFPWRGGRHPWLDVVIETDEKLIGIESKRFEPFEGHSKPSLSEAYWRPVWGDRMRPFEALRDALKDGLRYQHLDAAQLLKHAFGLRTQAARTGKTAVLIYLYAEPAVDRRGNPLGRSKLAAHRAEVKSFAERAVGTDITFVHFDYRQLVESWLGSPPVADHAARLMEYFDVGDVHPSARGLGLSDAAVP